MKELKQAFLLEDVHRVLITRLLSKLWDGTDYRDFCHRFLSGELVVWTTSDGYALVVTEVIQYKTCKELFIYGIVGERILCKRSAIIEDLKELAKLNNCKFMGAEAAANGWHWLGRGLGFNPVSTRYLKEL